MQGTTQATLVQAKFQQQFEKIEPLVWLIGAILVLSVVIPKRRRARGSRSYQAVRRNGPPITRKPSKAITSRPLMGYEERRFFEILQVALPNHHIFTQVSFNALLTHAPHLWGDVKRRVRGNFNHNSADFVVCDKASCEVVAIVEYDGSGHCYDDDARRDAMLTQAGYRVERFGVGYTMEAVRNKMGGFLNIGAPIRESKWVGEETTQF